MQKHLVQVRKLVRDLGFRPWMRGEDGDESNRNPG